MPFHKALQHLGYLEGTNLRLWIQGSGINDMKSSYCSHGPNSQLEVDIVKVEGCLDQYLNWLLDDSVLMDLDRLNADKGIMFSKELDQLVRTSILHMNIGDQIKRSFVITRQDLPIFLVENQGTAFKSFPSTWHILDKYTPPHESVGSMIASGHKSSWV